MKLRAITIAAIAVTTACNREPQVSATNASVAEVAEKVAKAGAGESFVRPGLWESRVTIEQLSVPGMPTEMAAKMKSMMGEQASMASRQCLTPEDVKRPKADFFDKGGKECRYDRFNMGNGKIDAQMRCGGSGATQVMQMAGTYSPDSYQMRMSNKMEASAQGANGAMDMRMRVDARRVGECTGKEG